MTHRPDDFDETLFHKVRDAFCEALELDDHEVMFESTVIDDLGAESLDLLDVVFRLERTFDIQIPRGGIEARAEVDGADPGQVDGRLTEAGAARLHAMMPEVPASEITVGMKSAELGRVFRVGTFYNIVVALLREKEA